MVIKVGNKKSVDEHRNELVRVELLKWISEGRKQKYICDKIGLSGCSLSLYINQKRFLTDEFLDGILNVIK